MKKNPIARFIRAAGAKSLALAAGLIVATTTTPSVEASTDYGPAVWRPVCSGHWYSSGYGKKFYVIHDIEGYYWGCISYFRQCSTGASVHYTTNAKKDSSSDSAAGEVTQMVRDAYYAWHARCWNQYSMGTEHEGFVSNPAWFTETQYQVSGTLTRSKANKYGMSKDRNRIIGHDQKRISAWRSWMASIGYSSSFYSCNDHTDPGPYWQWGHYMDIVRGTASTPSAPSGLKAATYSASRIDLTWTDNSGIESGFKVERSTSSGSGFSQIGTTAANDKTYSATGLASGTKYYFRVRAYNAAGNSGYSGVASATTKDTIAAAPSALTATAVNDDVINLAWTDNSGNEDGFRVYRSTDGTNFTSIATVGINVKTYSNTGLTGNRKYWYRVYAYNTAGNSGASNTASDTTAPQAPSALTAAAGSGTAWNTINLTWTDNANAEVGFKIERGTAAAGPFTQIATNAASDATYTDTGLAANTTYYYRVRTYNANGNSLYSNTASSPTGNAPPVLTAIGNKTVAAGSLLTFTAAATDPNKVVTTTTWQTFQSYAHTSQMESILFNRPLNSASTSAFMDTSTNYTLIRTNGPAGNGSTTTLKAGWGFKTGLANYWVRLNTFNVPTNPNPAIALDQIVRFKIQSSKAIKVGIGIRETGTTAAYGANGGTTGTIEWVGVTNVVSGNPVPNKLINTTNWTTLSYNIPFEPQVGFTGDGVIAQTGKGVLEHIAIRGEGGTGAYAVYFDDFAVVAQNTLAFTLDAGAPAGATIGRRTGKFTWTPTAAQAGLYTITVRVTDQGGAVDFETIKVTVLGSGNNPPTLAAIGNKTAKEGTALTFTATATDPDAGQTLTFSLDAGAPSGASITTAGAFSWNPSEAQGPGTYPITVRVTDNGSPSSNDFETISVSVAEANNAPTLAAIADQTITEGQTLNVTASGSDSDVPAQSLTYSVAGPVGMTINASSGAISYTPSEDDGGDVNQVTVTVKDNGSPALSSSRTFNVTVNEANTAPVVTLGTKNDYAPVAMFDELDDESVDGHNNSTLFRVPYFSSSTTAFLDSTSYSYVTNDFPRDEVLNNSFQALYVNMTFKTNVGAWCRLTTFTSSGWTNSYAYPSPTIALNQKVRLKIWADKSIKLAMGIRETNTGNPIGQEGGTTGQIEWIGATASGSPAAPVPTRTINAGVWTQVEFNIATETKAALPGSGDGVVTATKGTLEHLAIVPNAGTGNYTIYIDDVEVLIQTASNNITVNSGDTVRFTATSTDADRPAQGIAYSLGAGAPTNASISAVGGDFEWTVSAADAGAHVVTVTGTDDGTPALSGSANITINVVAINTQPKLEKIADQIIEVGSGQSFTFDAVAVDEDLPAQTVTYSIVSGPAGATINSSTGTFTWTPPAGTSTNFVTIRATDNGSPALFSDQTVALMVVAANTAPTLSLGTGRAAESVVNYESFTNATPNEQVMFKKPANSATTSAYIDTAATNYTSVTTSFPAGNATAGSKVLRATWSFKTGTSNYWVRLTTGNTTLLPNPTINASARLKFDIYTTKSLKVGLGIRETGTTAENGANGGTTGAIEYVGCSSQVGTTPVPTRTVNAATWTTLEFTLPSEPCQTLTGDSILAAGQQVLEHLILVGNGGTGAYDVYLDNFEVVTTTALPGTVNMKANSTLTFTATATDPNPGSGITYGIDADFAEAHPTAIINETNGVFTWVPSTAEVGTSSITVTADDNPTNGGISKGDSKTLTVNVTSDTLGSQGDSTSGTFVAGGDTVTLTWDSAIDASYLIQSKTAGGDWTTVQTVTASSSNSSVDVTNNGNDAYYRVVQAEGGAAGE